MGHATQQLPALNNNYVLQQDSDKIKIEMIHLTHSFSHRFLVRFLRFCCFNLAFSLFIILSLTYFSISSERSTVSVGSKKISNESELIQAEQNSIDRAIVMSCPMSQPQNHPGSWKPQRMSRGVETILHQIIATNSTLPVMFGYYMEEKEKSSPWCRKLSRKYARRVPVFCFEVKSCKRFTFCFILFVLVL